MFMVTVSMDDVALQCWLASQSVHLQTTAAAAAAAGACPRHLHV